MLACSICTIQKNLSHPSAAHSPHYLTKILPYIAERIPSTGREGLQRPHEPTIEENRLYGRGAFDMKGGLAATMATGAAACRNRLRGNVIVAAVIDEESASLGTSVLVNATLGSSRGANWKRPGPRDGWTPRS